MVKNNSFIMLTIGVVISVVLVSSVLIPIIGDASAPDTETIETLNEDGYGSLAYQESPELAEKQIVYAYMKSTYRDGIFTIQRGYLDQLETVATIDINELNEPLILYSDDNITIYIDNGSYHFTGTVFEYDSVPIDVPTLYAGNSTSGAKYNNSGQNVTIPSIPTYYYAYNDNGDYANFVGDNPPTMDTPAVSVAGSYIGEKYSTKTITVEKPYASMLSIIPVIALISVIIFTIGFYTYRRQ